MNNLQTSYILLTHQQEAMPEWMQAERYNFTESKGLKSFFRFLHR